MSDHSLPTDSILRRHFEQHAASLGLPPPPEDSILRRHYLHLSSAVGVGEAAEPATRSAAASPASAPARTTVAERPKGWFARLMGKMFGN